MKKIAVVLGVVLAFGLCAGAQAQNGPPAGIDYDEALRQANELLRQSGIDPEGHADGHSGDAVAVSEPAERSGFQPLTLSAIKGNPDVWPAEVTMTETVDFSGGLTLRKGQPLSFVGFDKSGEVYVDYGDNQLTLPPNYTDLVRRANDVARGQAKADGFRGRLIEQLDRKVYIKDGDNLRTADASEIDDADFYLFYHSSQSCQWSGRFTPDLVKTVDRLKAEYPGKIKVIYVSSDRNLQELKTHFDTVGAHAVIPPKPQWYIDTFSLHHPRIRQINQPSFMLMNANGRLLDSGMRRNNDYSDMFAGIEELPAKLANDDLYIPSWMRLAEPRAMAALGVAPAPLPTPARASTPAPSGPVVGNTDSSLAGPLPYTTTLRDGTEVPGLVIYDTRSTGNRIPALTLQAFPAHKGEPGFYRIAFRQVLGKTYGGKPLLAGWITSETRKGARADDDLAEQVGHFKALHAKFQDWRETAIDNGVTDFEKEMYVMPRTYFDSRVTRRNTRDMDLELYFKIFDDPKKAVFKGSNWSLTYADLDAFERLIPQIDSLVSQMPGEIERTARAKDQREDDAKKTDALFN
ncbi:MAG: thioredoxin-like domain-containing protein [Pseudomonadota bacterium]